jgi:hypothetical protein
MEDLTWHQLSIGLLLLSGMFAGVLAMLETGRRIRLRQKARHAEGAGLGTVDGAVFGLMGLLIAFTFSGAASRFDQRRALIVEEANDIGTAYLRLDLLAPESQPVLRQKFRDYLDARLAAYRALPDMNAARGELERSTALQKEIWAAAVAATPRAPTPQAAMLLLPALNAMIDITTTRTAATRMHPPVLIFVLLGVLALVCSLLAGYGMAASGARSWVHILSFAVVVTMTVYLIVDLEFPRLGLIRVSAFDQVLADVRQSME